MRLFVLAAAFFIAALAAPTPAAAQVDGSRYFIRLIIVTGDDDLRGGRDSVRGSYRIGETWSTPVILNLRGTRWADHSRNVVDLPWATEPAGRLNRLRLQTSFRGGVDGDNWNMQSIDVQLCPRPGTGGPCLGIGQHAFKRFTGDDGTLIFTLTLPPRRL